VSQIQYKIQPWNDSASVENILRTLPEWFGIEGAIVSYCAEAAVLPTYFVIRDDGTKIGFACLRFNNEFTAEIHVMGILREFQGKGVGQALVEHLAEQARQRSCEYLMVKTVGPSHTDVNYAQTREFYLQAGFRPLAEFDSIWPGNPCLIMARKI
jgi:GNAT superfamily N-acetyltransferase